MLRLTNIIEKKKNGSVLSNEEISYFINAVACKKDSCLPLEVADPCQIGALMMAVFLKGINDEETSALTKAMKLSGHVFDWPPEWKHLVVDKHSTGGVGDKVSLILAPVLAACGLKVPMIAGRSLAHTGGTLDKLESIPGFNVHLSVQHIQEQVAAIGCCIAGQTEEIVPADKVLCRCRDLTSTVSNLGLIISSITSKKLAEGCTALVYDVKFGGGGQFIKLEDAEELARKLVHVSSTNGPRSSALLTSMDVPTGTHIGNSLEVMESVQCLRNQLTTDVMELVYELGSELLMLTDLVDNRDDGVCRVKNSITSGEAIEKFQEMIIHQGVATKDAHQLCYGNPQAVLGIAPNIKSITYIGHDGYINHIDARTLGEIWKDMIILCPDSSVVSGFVLCKKVGDYIKNGDTWLELHQNEPVLAERILQRLNSAICVSVNNSVAVKRIHKIIRSGDLNAT